MEELLEAGTLVPSGSPCRAPVLFVPKPDGTICMRICIDCREVNKVTQRIKVPQAELFAGCYKGRVSVACGCYSLQISSVCYTVVLRHSSMIM